MLSRFFEKPDERHELGARHVPELPAVERRYRTVQFREDLETLLRRAHHHHTAILATPVPGYQAQRLQTVEKARNVRLAGDHPLRHRLTRKSLPSRPTKDPEDVELGLRQAVFLEQMCQLVVEAVVGTKDLHDRPLLQILAPHD